MQKEKRGCAYFDTPSYYFYGVEERFSPLPHLPQSPAAVSRSALPLKLKGPTVRGESLCAGEDEWRLLVHLAAELLAVGAKG